MHQQYSLSHEISDFEVERACVFHVYPLFQLWLCDTMLVKKQPVQKGEERGEEQSTVLRSAMTVLMRSGHTVDPRGTEALGLIGETQ